MNAPRLAARARWFAPLFALLLLLSFLPDRSDAQRLLEAAGDATPGAASGAPHSSEAANGTGATPLERVGNLRVQLVADTAHSKPGQAFRLGLRLLHDPGWHTYWRNPGDTGLPTVFEPAALPGLEVGAIQWPTPERIGIGPLANLGFEGEALLVRELRWNPEAPSAALRLDVRAQWLVCHEICVPGESTLHLELPVGDGDEPPANVEVFDAAARRSPAARPALSASWFAQTLPKEGASASNAVKADPFGAIAGHAWLLIEDAASAGIDPATIDRFEFLPDEVDIVSAPAEQHWYLDRQGRPVIRLALLENADASGGAGFAMPRDGVLIAHRKGDDDGTGRPRSDASSRSWLVRVAAASARPDIEGASRGIAVPWRDPQLKVNRMAGIGGTATPSADSGNPVGSSVGGSVGGSVGSSVDAGLAGAMLAALAGGLILNLMPCVFPVIGLKVLSFAGQGGDHGAGEDGATRRRHARRSAIWFCAGIVLSFVALAGLLLALRALGQSVGWGFQLQSPVVVSLLAMLFLAIGLNLSGLFESALVLTRVDQGGTQSAFVSGVLAVVVAAPCTAPFMGGAIGYTLGAPVVGTLAIFVALGLGMSLPYLILAWRPSLLRLLPRPGAWMETLKQLLSFPMFATAAWLAWVLTLQAGADALLSLLLAAVALALACWAWGGAQRASASQRSGSRTAYRIASLASVVVAGLLVTRVSMQAEEEQPAKEQAAKEQSSREGATKAKGTDWRRWSDAAVREAREKGPVFVDFTAAWCISCQANKKLVLEREAVQSLFRSSGVTAFRADWTKQDPAITQALAAHGRNGVPLYLVYARGASAPEVLPEILSVDIVESALSRARGG